MPGRERAIGTSADGRSYGSRVFSWTRVHPGPSHDIPSVSSWIMMTMWFGLWTAKPVVYRRRQKWSCIALWGLITILARIFEVSLQLTTLRHNPRMLGTIADWEQVAGEYVGIHPSIDECSSGCRLTEIRRRIKRLPPLETSFWMERKV